MAGSVRKNGTTATTTSSSSSDTRRVVIPTGYHVGVSFWLIHRSDQYFDRPLEFRPDRWVQQRQCSSSTTATTRQWEDRDDAPHDAFFAFSDGGRRCPGKSFALEEATLIFAILLRNLKFDIPSNYKLEIEWRGVVQKPRGGVPATISLT